MLTPDHYYRAAVCVNFLGRPIEIWTAGAAFAAFAFLAVLLITVRKLLFGDPVDGWASLACIITFLGGVQLFCMGIMGQYIAKTYTETKKRPHYIISDTNMQSIERIR